MAAGRVNTLSLKAGIFLCLFIAFNNSILEITSNVAGCKVRDIFFAAQVASRVEIQAIHPPVKCYMHNGAKEVSSFQNGYVACKLLQHASLAFALLVLAGNVDINPGYRRLANIRKCQGLRLRI